jgi:ornithine cyclodeaminase/alanine dehydrogenase-like protein (mu-crystallin family)
VADGIWLRFVSGPDIDSLGLTRLEIVDAVEDAVREHGEGRTSFEPRVHLMPDNGGIARTGAMTTVGARHLARRDSKILAHAGARGTAWWNVTMLDDLFDLDEIRVTSRRPESREKFAAELSAELSTPVRVVATAEEAFDGADVPVEATRLIEPEPLLRTAAVRPGSFVVPYGTVSAVELDLLDVMDKVVVDDWRDRPPDPPEGRSRRHRHDVAVPLTC